MERFGGKQSGASGSGKDDPGKSGSDPGKSPIVDPHASGTSTSGGPSAPVPTAAQAVSSMAPLSIPGEVASFGGAGGVAGELVAALPSMTSEQDVARHSIAMFQYMHGHAATLAHKVATDLDLLAQSEPDSVAQNNKKKAYLLQLQDALFPKLGGKGFWADAAERDMLILGALQLDDYMRKGKVELLAKATEARQQNRPLVGLLANVAMNMEAKSYGRRAESMEAVNVASLPVAAGAVVRPQVGVPFPCNAAHASYVSDVTYKPVAAAALEVDGEYTMSFNGNESISVTVKSNDGTHLVFSEVS